MSLDILRCLLLFLLAQVASLKMWEKMVQTRHGKQNCKCRDCGRQFVQAPQWRMISAETKGIID